MTQQSNTKSRIAPDWNLSIEQQQLINDIVSQCEEHQAKHKKPEVILIEGNAGCGKSLVLNTLFNTLQSKARNTSLDNTPLSGTKNFLLVNHPEMLKLYRETSRQNKWLKLKDFERPTTFINTLQKQGEHASIVLVDEAHLLLTRPDRYNHFEQENHLTELLKLADILILVYDPLQVIKFKSFWQAKTLRQILGDIPVKHFYLHQQFRMKADSDVLNWVDGFIHKKILPLPHKQHNYDFRLFDDAKAMYDLLLQKNQQVGMCRILATYDYPYRLDGHDYFVQEGSFSLRWDRSKPSARLSWAEREDTVEEVGSVYTIQGFDLNYAAVIVGPSFQYDADHDAIKIDTAVYQDKMAFSGTKDIQNVVQAKENIMLNALNVLLTRGTQGLYIYISDAPLRQRIMSLQSDKA